MPLGATHCNARATSGSAEVTITISSRARPPADFAGSSLVMRNRDGQVRLDPRCSRVAKRQQHQAEPGNETDHVSVHGWAACRILRTCTSIDFECDTAIGPR